MAKNCTACRGRLRCAVSFLFCLLRFQRGDHAGFDIGCPVMILHQRIHQRGEFGTALLPPGDVGMADKAVLDPHRASCHGHFAQIECRATAARSAANHDKAALGSADDRVGGEVAATAQQSGDPVRFGPGNDRPSSGGGQGRGD